MYLAFSYGTTHFVKIIAKLLALCLFLQATSCAYLFHGTSDQITINSADPNTVIYVNDQLIGRGNASYTADRGKTYTIVGKDAGCTDASETTGDKFDPASLLGIFIDAGLISILVIDMAATDAAWKTYPLSYTVNPICPLPAVAGTVPNAAPAKTAPVSMPAATPALAASSVGSSTPAAPSSEATSSWSPPPPSAQSPVK